MADPMTFEEVDAVSSMRGFEDADGGWLAGARYVVEHNSAVMVQGSILDLFSASAMVQVFDALSERHQAKLLAMPMVAAHDLVFKILDRVEHKVVIK